MAWIRLIYVLLLLMSSFATYIVTGDLFLGLVVVVILIGLTAIAVGVNKFLQPTPD